MNALVTPGWDKDTTGDKAFAMKSGIFGGKKRNKVKGKSSSKKGKSKKRKR